MKWRKKERKKVLLKREREKATWEGSKQSLMWRQGIEEHAHMKRADGVLVREKKIDGGGRDRTMQLDLPEGVDVAFSNVQMAFSLHSVGTQYSGGIGT